MADATKTLDLLGRVIVTGTIEVLTGLHIGRGREGVTIGGVDNPVIRDTLTQEPYIPGSSLRGKLRSLAEKREPGLPFNQSIGSFVKIHVCHEPGAYSRCPVCRIYGVPAQDWSGPARLVVRDVRLTADSRAKLKAADTDLPWTELKYEVAIDRVTSAANPRPLERVPAGAQFGPFEMIFSIYEDGDVDLLPKLVEAMQLLEDDYLGGAGSRGSGQVRFRDLRVELKPLAAYAQPQAAQPSQSYVTLGELVKGSAALKDMIRKQIVAVSHSKE